MPGIAADTRFDSTLAFLSGGYPFISDRCRRLHADAFETRLMLRRVVCALGADAARMFFHPGRFTRRGAVPGTALVLLQDLGSVQTLDGADHQERKQAFMALLDADGVGRLAEIAEDEWRRRLPHWSRAERVTLLPEVQGILCRAAARWAGLRLTREEAEARTREFAAMIDGAGSFGPRNWNGMALRRRTETWARGVVAAVRRGRLRLPEDSPTHRIAWLRDAGGRLPDVKVAAVELINLLRPTVAVANFVVMAAHALHVHPDAGGGLGDGDRLTEFVQEVRRYYPFFPVLGGRALVDFEWRERWFAPGDWVLLDLFGTDRDPRIWGDPEVFRPDRFRGRDESPFTFIPQGGGDFRTGHRCPGEPATIALMRTAVKMLTSGIRYAVPEQDLTIDLRRIPALPRSRFIISRVTAAQHGQSRSEATGARQLTVP